MFCSRQFTIIREPPTLSLTPALLRAGIAGHSPETPRSTPNPQTTTNMLSLIPKMGKRPAGCAKRPLFPAESGNKLISDCLSEVLRRDYGRTRTRYGVG